MFDEDGDDDDDNHSFLNPKGESIEIIDESKKEEQKATPQRRLLDDLDGIFDSSFSQSQS